MMDLDGAEEMDEIACEFASEVAQNVTSKLAKTQKLFADNSMPRLRASVDS